jgi:hypothetical protein
MCDLDLNVAFHLLFLLPKSSFGEHKIYPSQTKILEGGTKDEMRIFEALFKVLRTQFGPRTVEKSVEHPEFIFCSSFQNLRLGSIKLRNFCSLHGESTDTSLCLSPISMWRAKSRAFRPRVKKRMKT